MTPTAAPSAAPWANRIVGSGEEAPDQLLANPANWRVHPKAQRQALAGVLDQVGWVQQVLVNRRTGHVVDGHLRVALAIRQEAPTVPVLYVDLSPEEEALVLASLDPLAAMAGIDEEKLRELLADISVDSEALAAMLAELTPHEPRSGLTDPDDVPDPPDAATTQPGDLWVLGDHRLLCGDAGSTADFDRLLGGATIDLLLTDPPYNVRVEPRSNNAIAAGLSSFPANGKGGVSRSKLLRGRLADELGDAVRGPSVSTQVEAPVDRGENDRGACSRSRAGGGRRPRRGRWPFRAPRSGKRRAFSSRVMSAVSVGAAGPDWADRGPLTLSRAGSRRC